MKNSEYINANKLAWNETAPIHKKMKFDNLLTQFKKKGYSLLDLIEKEIFTKLEVKGKDVIQLCCNNGREILSVKNMGAGICVGIDISEGFIDQGKDLAKVANQELELLSTDVYQISEKYFNSFDIVYITIGAITWLPDLMKFFDIIQKLLREGGHLFLYDFHPILNMFESDKKDPQIPKLPYFQSEPYIEDGGTDYYDKNATITSTMYSFQHTLTDIFKCCISNGLEVKEFKEYNHDISIVFKFYEQFGYPMSYSLLAQKKEK